VLRCALEQPACAFAQLIRIQEFTANELAEEGFLEGVENCLGAHLDPNLRVFRVIFKFDLARRPR